MLLASSRQLPSFSAPQIPNAGDHDSRAADDFQDPYEKTAALVRSAQQGDRDAQSELVHRYQRRVAGFVRKLIQRHSAVEDIVQTIMIRMIRRLPFLRDPKVFEFWLFRMARNEVVDAIRRMQCRVTLVEETDDHVPTSDRNDHAHFEITEAVNHAIECLTHPEREIIMLIIAGHTYRSIAARTGLTASTVKIRVYRMRQILRPRMLDALGEVGPSDTPAEAKTTSRVSKRNRAGKPGRVCARRSAEIEAAAA